VWLWCSRIHVSVLPQASMQSAAAKHFRLWVSGRVGRGRAGLAGLLAGFALTA